MLAVNELGIYESAEYLYPFDDGEVMKGENND